MRSGGRATARAVRTKAGRAACMRAPTRRASRRALRGCSRYERLLDVLWIDGQIKTCRGGKPWVIIGERCRRGDLSDMHAAVAACAEPAAAQQASQVPVIALDSRRQHRSIINQQGERVCAGARAQPRHGRAMGGHAHTPRRCHPTWRLVRPWSTPSAGPSARRFARRVGAGFRRISSAATTRSRVPRINYNNNTHYSTVLVGTSSVPRRNFYKITTTSATADAVTYVT